DLRQVRAAQHLLSEKGSILDIPREMSACMTDGRYMELVKLYRKAHTTYSSSILGKVRVEAEAVGQQACIRLVEILRSPDVSLEEQVDAVGHLQDLQYDGDEPLQACFDYQKGNFLDNASQCREAMEALLVDAFAYRRARGRIGRNSDAQQLNTRNHTQDGSSSTIRSDARRVSSAISPARSLASKPGSTSEDLTDSEASSRGLCDFSPATRNGGGGRFFDFHEGDVLLAMDISDDEFFFESSRHLEDDGRSDATAGRVQAGLQELEGMELDEDIALPLAPGMDALTHRVSVARLQHVSNLAWCLGSWLPHLASLAVLLIRLEHSKNGRGTDENNGLSSPHVHIRKLCGPGAYGGGASDYADGDTASITTSGPRAASTAHETPSTLGSDDSFAAGKRDRIGTKAEKEFTNLFESWLNSTTTVLRAAIFGDDTVSDKTSGSSNGRRSGASTVNATPLFAGNKQGGLSNKYAGEPHLKDPLDSRYLRQAFSSLAHLYDSLSQALGGSWEGDMVLSPGLRALEKACLLARLSLVKEAQALHVRSEMAALATEAKGLMDVDPWLAPEPPHPPGGTRLPHLFGALAHERMINLVELLPRAEWSAAEITHGLGDAVQCLLSCVTALGTRAYEASRMDHSNGAPLALSGGATTTGGHGEEGLSADHQLLCQIGNCLQLETVILPDLWDTAVDLFDASRAGVVSDRKRTQKVQEKVMNKYLKHKYRELKMYVKNGWWGYARPAPRSGRQHGNTSEGVMDQSRSDRASSMRDQQRVSTSISRQRTSLRLKRGTFTYASAGSTASVARQASMLSSKSEDNKGDTSSASGSNTRRGSVVNRRTGLKAALKISMRTPKPQSLPSYLVKVLLSLVQARLEAQEALRGLLYRKAGMHDGKMRKDILYADFVLRESARQASVMEIVCDCANARVVGEGHLGAKPLDGSDPVEQAEKIAQAEFLRDALYRFLPSATLDRVNRVVKRLQAGKFEGTLGRSTGNPSSMQSSSKPDPQRSSSARDGLVRVGALREGRDKDGATAEQTGKSASSASNSDKNQASVSDSLAAAMPGSFLTATDLQELARVYVVCLK
ncbi:unnamed protein product, partial [Ectocarpus sp. 13 AM-2016]